MASRDKTLYWWNVHLERFLKLCRDAGRSQAPFRKRWPNFFWSRCHRGIGRRILQGNRRGGVWMCFCRSRRGGRGGRTDSGGREPKFQLKANRAGLTTEDTEGAEGLISTKQLAITN